MVGPACGISHGDKKDEAITSIGSISYKEYGIIFTMHPRRTAPLRDDFLNFVLLWIDAEVDSLMLPARRFESDGVREELLPPIVGGFLWFKALIFHARGNNEETRRRPCCWATTSTTAGRRLLLRLPFAQKLSC